MRVGDRIEVAARVRQKLISLLPLSREEGFVPAVVKMGKDDRSVGFHAELIAAVPAWERYGCSSLAFQIVVLIVLSIQPGTPCKLVNRAVNRVGSGLQRNVHRTSACAPVRRVVGIKHDLEFGDGVDRHIRGRPAVRRIVRAAIKVLLQRCLGNSRYMNLVAHIVLIPQILRRLGEVNARAQRD